MPGCSKSFILTGRCMASSCQNTRNRNRHWFLQLKLMDFQLQVGVEFEYTPPYAFLMPWSIYQGYTHPCIQSFLDHLGSLVKGTISYQVTRLKFIFYSVLTTYRLIVIDVFFTGIRTNLQDVRLEAFFHIRIGHHRICEDDTLGSRVFVLQHEMSLPSICEIYFCHHFVCH